MSSPTGIDAPPGPSRTALILSATLPALGLILLFWLGLHLFSASSAPSSPPPAPVRSSTPASSPARNGSPLLTGEKPKDNQRREAP